MLHAAIPVLLEAGVHLPGLAEDGPDGVGLGRARPAEQVEPGRVPVDDGPDVVPDDRGSGCSGQRFERN